MGNILSVGNESESYSSSSIHSQNPLEFRLLAKNEITQKDCVDDQPTESVTTNTIEPSISDEELDSELVNHFSISK